MAIITRQEASSATHSHIAVTHDTTDRASNTTVIPNTTQTTQPAGNRHCILRCPISTRLPCQIRTVPPGVVDRSRFSKYWPSRPAATTSQPPIAHTALAGHRTTNRTTGLQAPAQRLAPHKTKRKQQQKHVSAAAPTHPEWRCAAPKMGSACRVTAVKATTRQQHMELCKAQRFACDMARAADPFRDMCPSWECDDLPAKCQATRGPKSARQ